MSTSQFVRLFSRIWNLLSSNAQASLIRQKMGLESIQSRLHQKGRNPLCFWFRQRLRTAIEAALRSDGFVEALLPVAIVPKVDPKTGLTTGTSENRRYFQELLDVLQNLDRVEPVINIPLSLSEDDDLWELSDVPEARIFGFDAPDRSDMRPTLRVRRRKGMMRKQLPSRSAW